MPLQSTSSTAPSFVIIKIYKVLESKIDRLDLHLEGLAERHGSSVIRFTYWNFNGMSGVGKNKNKVFHEVLTQVGTSTHKEFAVGSGRSAGIGSSTLGRFAPGGPTTGGFTLEVPIQSSVIGRLAHGEGRSAGSSVPTEWSLF
ncbi:hypothetical protein LOK49_Contig201G00002 [Camellia lanceoleosa]|nr:hypothetical protein LOK49_Contig201G00002 [Camellia lanceoleosa]